MYSAVLFIALLALLYPPRSLLLVEKQQALYQNVGETEITFLKSHCLPNHLLFIYICVCVYYTSACAATYSATFGAVSSPQSTQSPNATPLV